MERTMNKLPITNQDMRRKCKPIKVVCNYKRIKYNQNNCNIRLYSIKTFPEIPLNSKLIYTAISKNRRLIEDKYGIFFQQGNVLYCNCNNNNTEEFIFVNTADNNSEYTVTITPTAESLSVMKTFQNREDYMMKSKQFMEKLLHSILNANTNLIRFNKKSIFDCSSLGNAINSSVIVKGFSTAICVGDSGPMVRITARSKLINSKNCLQKLEEFKSQDEIKEYFIGRSVLTNYGTRRVYQIEDVTFNETVNSVLIENRKDKSTLNQISLYEYYNKFHNRKISNVNQPLFIFYRMKNDKKEVIHLIPELCLITGIEESMKADEGFNKNLSKTRMRPDEKLKQINCFSDFFYKKEKGDKKNYSPYELKEKWGIELDGGFVNFEARELPAPKLVFKDRKEVYPGRGGKFRLDKVPKTGNCFENWAVLVERNDDSVRNILDNMKKAGESLGLHISRPNIIQVDRNRGWQGTVFDRKGDLKSCTIILCMLFKQDVRIYKEVKSVILSKLKVPCQCLVISKHRGGNLSSITGVLNQMITKTGGQLFDINLGDTAPELRNVSSVIGIEVAKLGKDSTKYTFTATYNKYHNSQYTETIIKKNDEKGFYPINNFITTLNNSIFKKKPEVFIIYRSAVNVYQNKVVQEEEIQPLKEFLEGLSHQPRFAFIYANKQVDVKFFEDGGRDTMNPQNGLCVDNYVVSPGSYEFYIQPQFVNQGTATPTKFQVLKDTTQMSLEELEHITYHMCYYYWNWTGPIRVPAVLKMSEVCSKFNKMTLGDEKLEEHIRKNPYFI